MSNQFSKSPFQKSAYTIQFIRATMAIQYSKYEYLRTTTV